MDQKREIDEEARLAALHRLNILDTPPEYSFDRITRLAQMALQMPIVTISIIDRDRQWFKSKQGLDGTEICRSLSFCVYAIEQDEPFIVENAPDHPLFRDNPLVTGEPFIRYYIGIPLRMRDGFVIGTLCAIDQRPRTLSADEIEILRDLACMVVDEIELRQMATTDGLTGALTRRGFDVEMDREASRSRRSQREFSVVALDIDHFKSVNDRFGHSAGDFVLQSVAKLIQQQLRSGEFVARIGGEEFVIALPETGIDDARGIAERIRQNIAGTAVRVQTDVIRVTASFGIASVDAADESWAAALKKADAALYDAKRGGRNTCVCHAPRASNPAAA